jgi:oligoendopeptidase F
MAKNIKTSWDLGFLYKSIKDPQIEKDLKDIDKTCSDFAKQYKDSDFVSNKKTLLKALADFELLLEKTNSVKPWWYFELYKDIDSQNKEVLSMLKKTDESIKNSLNKIVFFRLSLSKIEQSFQKELLNDNDFKRYRYFLLDLFKKGQYKLSEKEELLNNLLENTSYEMWVDGQEKLLNRQTVLFKGENIPLSKAFSIIKDLAKKDRDVLYKKLIDCIKSIDHFAEAEINAIFSYKKVLDTLKGYKNPYSASVLNNENDEKSIETLAKTVTDSFHISERFYTLHKKLLKLKTLEVQDINVAIGKITKKIDFQKSVELVCNAFEKFDPKFKDLLLEFISNGQIDVYPKKGKRGGAYCWGMNTEKTFILLNHTDGLESAETLAHEMGHAIHTELAKGQNVFYRKYSIATAEVASTFFEQLFLLEIEKELTEKEKIILLHTKIKRDIATIFRQIACFNFENELHQEIRKQGYLESADIAKIMTKNLKSYMGKSVKLTDNEGYTYVKWPHIRSFFYTYTYAYGQIISRAMLSMWQKDNSFKEKVIAFLKAGRSDTPENIFKSIGIDTSKPEFFKEGLLSIEKDIDELERLTKKSTL